jgi:nucleotide-binding universal stress UspA family protein
MYKTVLVAFDDSSFSRAALDEALSWIKTHTGRVILVHAVYFNEEEYNIAPEQRERRFELGRKLCYQTREAITSGSDVDVESLVCEGEPHDVIVDVAEAKKTDLIAIGTHGRKGLKKLFMGSVTSRVIAKSPCDVLVVKRPHRKPKGKYGSILVSYDGSNFGKTALNRACVLSKMDGSDLTVLYVIPQYEQMIEFFRTSLIEQNLLQDAQEIMNEAMSLASGHGISIKTVIEEGDPTEKIIETTKSIGSDLIVGGTHGWKGIDKAIMGSTMENLIVNVSCPVLVVRGGNRAI